MKTLRSLVIASIIATSLLLLLPATTFFINNYSQNPGPVLSNGGIAGGDFIAFYAGGYLFRTDRESLYKFEAQKELYHSHFKDTSLSGYFSPFAYPPLVAMALSAFTLLPFYEAYLLFSSVSLALAAIGVLLIVAPSNIWFAWKATLVLVALSFVPLLMDTIGGGQMASFGVLLVGCLAVAIAKKKDLLSGLIFSLSYYKPPLFFFFLASLFVLKQWRVVSGFLIGAVFLVGATIMSVGFSGSIEYLSKALNYRSGGELFPGFTLEAVQGVGAYATFIRLHVSENLSLLAWFVLNVGALVFFYRIARSKRPDSLLQELFPALIMVSLFLSLQVLRYDLSICLIPALLIFERALRRRGYLSAFLAISVLILISFARLYTPNHSIELAALFLVLTGVVVMETHA